MFDTENPRLKGLALRELAFYADLPVLMGCSKGAIKHLVCPPSTEKSRYWRDAKFPKPIYESPSGIRVWLVRDLENWLRARREYVTGRRLRAAALLHRPEIADRVLGRN